MAADLNQSIIQIVSAASSDVTRCA